MDDESAPALKNWFDEARFRSVAGELAKVHTGFDRKRFLKVALAGLEELSLMQRLRRMTFAAHEGMELEFLEAVEVLKELAPKIDHSFVTLFLPDYVASYGQENFDESMEALKFFTPFGSSEFAVREFLKMDLKRGLRFMRTWSKDEDEHVRRLSCEGCRPRLPWSFRLEVLVRDPEPVMPILDRLKADRSLYVRKSVANHLNDITKDHPTRVIEILRGWDWSNAHSAWIAKRALRTLIKAGDREALALMGAGEMAKVKVGAFRVEPRQIKLGEAVAMEAKIQSTSEQTQKLVIDYAVHYVKKSGGTSAKVFKWKELMLGAGEVLVLRKNQRIQNFTTRVHHAGWHGVELLINGEKLAADGFTLNVEG
ncbi:DNA alkylation repair protein [Phragmitibacter flavus]|uniref:DNA alkylation repair protein n=1 Tax=Phragmitibacter flavus TaxID=2576071 RepID=A0A5R8K7Q5_9BACT|nr:DNA alkylation repair protein [Phragmitibacter flavus]TLD68378.1 DNA alkylation repair protein [Phragmitibacter flavus]